MDILGKIRRLQEERGWSENHLAEQAHLSQSTINSLYRKGNVPTIPTLEAICRAFGMTVSQFLAEDSLPLSLIHISEPTRLGMISYAVFCLKKKKKQTTDKHSPTTDYKTKE